MSYHIYDICIYEIYIIYICIQTYIHLYSLNVKISSCLDSINHITDFTELFIIGLILLTSLTFLVVLISLLSQRDFSNINLVFKFLFGVSVSPNYTLTTQTFVDSCKNRCHQVLHNDHFGVCKVLHCMQPTCTSPRSCPVASQSEHQRVPGFLIFHKKN